jgi:hypothetical protein
MTGIGIALMSYLIGHTPYKDLIALSQLAEEQGFDAVVFPELVNDALACAEAVALGTTRITVGPCLTHVWWRYPALTATTAGWCLSLNTACGSRTSTAHVGKSHARASGTEVRNAGWVRDRRG